MKGCHFLVIAREVYGKDAEKVGNTTPAALETRTEGQAGEKPEVQA